MGKWELGPLWTVRFLLPVFVVVLSVWSLIPFPGAGADLVAWVRAHAPSVIGILAGSFFAVMGRPRYNPHG